MVIGDFVLVLGVCFICLTWLIRFGLYRGGVGFVLGLCFVWCFVLVILVC